GPGNACRARVGRRVHARRPGEPDRVRHQLPAGPQGVGVGEDVLEHRPGRTDRELGAAVDDLLRNRRGLHGRAAQHGFGPRVTAGKETAFALTHPPGLLSNFGHTVRVVLAIVLLLVVPGLIAARWFQLDDPFSRIALVPGMSLGLTLAAGVVVAGVHRAPFGA